MFSGVTSKNNKLIEKKNLLKINEREQINNHNGMYYISHRSGMITMA